MKKLSIQFLGFLLLTTGNLTAQNFEYALTQQNFAGISINAMLFAGDRIYLGGTEKEHGSPLIMVFDTLGHLLDHKIIIPDLPEHHYGYITDLRHATDSDLIQVTLVAATHCDFGPGDVFIWQLNQKLEKISELSVKNKSENWPVTSYSDTFFTVTLGEQMKLFDTRFNLKREINLPKGMHSATAIVYDDKIIAANSTQATEVHLLDQQGHILITKSIPETTKIGIIGESLISAGSDGVLRKYDPTTLELLDSFSFPGAYQTEFIQINENLVEIAFHRRDSTTIIQLLDQKLDLIQEVGLSPQYERKFLSILGPQQTLYHFSTYYQSNTITPVPGLIPVLRKISLSEKFNPVRPNLKITQVQLLNNLNWELCVEVERDSLCNFSSSYLHYEYTLENIGPEVINSFGHYVSSTTPNFCGFYQDYKFIDAINLAPGDRMTLRDSTKLNLVTAAPKLNFYAVCPNHLVNHDAGYFFTVEDISTASKQITKPRFLSLFPNPTNDFLKVNLGPDYALFSNQLQVEIFTSTGQTIKRENLQGDEISIKDLATGLYYLRIRNDKDFFLGSFIKTD